jgi:DNA-nicking Smr family endonuclease
VRTILYPMVRKPAAESRAKAGARASTLAPDAEGAHAESAEFRAAVRDVKPLPPPARIAHAVKPVRRRRTADAVHESLDERMPLLPSHEPDAALTAADATAGNAVLSYQRAGVRPQVMRRLRRGLYPSEDHLDLHGLNQSTAREYLAAFLERSRTAGARCVRIVHGKGYRSGARGPVLKVAVDLWLRRHSDVMAFTSARAIDGGTGAVYVLLRA